METELKYDVERIIMYNGPNQIPNNYKISLRCHDHGLYPSSCPLLINFG